MSVLREIQVEADENGDFNLPTGQVLSATVETKDVKYDTPKGFRTRPVRIASVWIVFDNEPEVPQELAEIEPTEDPLLGHPGLDY